MPDELLIPNENTSAPERADYPHLTGSHCESMVITAFLRGRGLPITEPLSFGLASALSYCYFPFMRIDGLPLLSYRMVPHYIVKSVTRLLKLPMRFETFRNPEDGRRRLDALLDEGYVVGLQGSIMYLTYFPDSWRFPFNGHNFAAYGRDAETGDYLISDPVVAVPTRCKVGDMMRARFARGALAPHGYLYYLEGDIPSTDISACVTPLLRAAILKNARMMQTRFLPFVSIGGMRMFAARMRRLPLSGPKVQYSRDFVGHIARMQEEIGTGGAGFRYMYVAFLKEAGQLLNNPALGELSDELGETICPGWRHLAMLAVRQSKERDPLDPRMLADLLDNLARKEWAFFGKLGRAV